MVHHRLKSDKNLEQRIIAIFTSSHHRIIVIFTSSHHHITIVKGASTMLVLLTLAYGEYVMEKSSVVMVEVFPAVTLVLRGIWRHTPKDGILEIECSSTT
jgi:hypothetical protein